MDKIDRTILELIKDNGRMSYSEIGKAAGLSRVAVKKRMDAMEKAGVIRGYRAVIDEEKVREGIRYTIDIEAIPEEYAEVVRVLRADRKLEAIYSTTGECRIHCLGRSANPSTMEAHVNYLFNHTKGIRKISWHILLSDLKRTEGESVDDGEKKRGRELHEICSRLGNLGRRLRFPVYLGKELLETPIEELELSVRSFNCLRRAEWPQWEIWCKISTLARIF